MIAFGIPTLDYLMGYDMSKKLSEQNVIHDNICIVGGPGQGKSLLALHLAATHAVLSPEVPVVYVSTDWSFTEAKKTYEQFDLHTYGYRIPNPYLRRKVEETEFLKDFDPTIFRTKLRRIEPTPDGGAKFLTTWAKSAAGKTIKVGFIDLKTGTAGDDWEFLLRFSTLLKRLKGENSFGTKPLIVIDAIEGIELLTGPKDQFGMMRTRRQRIAQLARLLSGLNYALLIEDQSMGNERYDEEFVSDVVIHLGTRDVFGYTERCVEVVKCRGTSHQLGRHPILFRSGKGSRTGGQPNADDPESGHSYVYAVPSIHARAASLLAERVGTI